MKISYVIKRARPVRLIAIGFVFTIITGAILLSLPISNVADPIPFLDHLFMATTSVCVTGLVTVMIAEQYSIFGQLVILALIQIGGLSLVSILSYVLVMAKRKIGLHEKKIIQESVNQSTISGMGKYIKRVITYTFVMESIGALLLSMVFVSEYGLKGIYYGIFHSISAFCNAGLDNLGSVSLLNYATNPLVNFTIMGLIVSGGLGYAVWFELHDRLFKVHFKKLYKYLSLHTKIVLKMTVFMIVSGTILIFLLEMNNPKTIGEMSTFNQIMTSMFQSVTLRTAGFSTINYGYLKEATKLIMVFYMFVGGAPGGTAGGIKVTTLLILVVYAIQSFKQEEGIVIEHRTIGKELIRKSYFLVSLYVVVVVVTLFILLLVEPYSALDLLFEIVSAVGTVGLSIGLTSQLQVISKVLIILCMYIGRTGPMSIYLSFLRKNQGNSSQVQYPKADILIG